MSRVDEALQAWEKRASGGASSPRSRVSVGEAPNRFGLGGYQREEPASPELPQPPEVTAPVAPAVAEFRRSAVSRAGVGADLEARLVTLASGSVSLEQYRRLAAVLHDVQLQQGLKTLMLTSALPGEGKTLTIVNLALTLSESYGRRVLIIDADLRWPSVHKVLGVENSAGLSEALQGERFDLSIHQVSPRLAVLTAGHPGLTPLAGLTSARMAAVIEECAKQFDWVLLDTPPVGLLPDAQLLARLTRAVVFVIAAGVTPAAAVERAVADLGPDCVIGTVLNRIDERRIPEAGYYSRYGETAGSI